MGNGSGIITLTLCPRHQQCDCFQHCKKPGYMLCQLGLVDTTSSPCCIRNRSSRFDRYHEYTPERESLEVISLSAIVPWTRGQFLEKDGVESARQMEHDAGKVKAHLRSSDIHGKQIDSSGGCK